MANINMQSFKKPSNFAWYFVFFGNGGLKKDSLAELEPAELQLASYPVVVDVEQSESPE